MNALVFVQLSVGHSVVSQAMPWDEIVLGALWTVSISSALVMLFVSGDLGCIGDAVEASLNLDCVTVSRIQLMAAIKSFPFERRCQ